jgi:hypothetical protein
MTGDDSYHAYCFKCKVCKNRIDELVFAKTSQGIYCMNCHSERMAKVRRHAQKKAEKAEREKERAAALAAVGNNPSRAQVTFSAVFKCLWALTSLNLVTEFPTCCFSFTVI